MMRVCKLEVMIVDTDNLGPQDVVAELENVSVANDCLAPKVVSVETREVEWSDGHPLNQRGWQDAFRKLFAKAEAPALDAVMMLGDIKVHVDPTMPRGTTEMRSGEQRVRATAEPSPIFTVGVLDIVWRQPAEPFTITGREGRVFCADIVACRTRSGRVSTDDGRAALQGAIVRAPDGALSKIVGVETFCMSEMGAYGRMGELGLLLAPVEEP